MTASLTSERPGKRDRLIAGARETIHRQGVEATTLADIAEASGVPLGNVYYYFKSKDDTEDLQRVTSLLNAPAHPVR
jgi:AcrR family transcriptional regulator